MEEKNMMTAKEQMQKEVEILETALLFRTRHELKVHINEQKKLLNKYFGCNYEIEELVTNTSNNYNRNNNYHNFNGNFNGNYNNNRGNNRGFFNNRNGSYNTPHFNNNEESMETQETYIEETGVIHTYESFMSNDNPFGYLDKVAVGDKIKYYSKTKGKVVIGLVENVLTNRNMYGNTVKLFCIRGDGKITYKDFR